MHELSRFESLIGKENLELIKNKKILIIGLGGVGSYALEAIVRSGINNLIIIDKDIIDITNLNRQLMALKSNIGKYKTDVFESRIKDINKNACITKITKEIKEEDIDDLIRLNPDYIIDACDTLSVKKELIRKSIKNNIKLISCMGMGNKLNPSLISITDIRKTSYDPLAKSIRKMVKDEKINKKIMVVSSIEKPIKSNVISSNSFVPATAGLLCASYVINDILKESKWIKN